MDILPSHLLPLLQDVCARYGRRASLIGWSMGGIFARAMAHSVPEAIRTVITLGTLLSSNPKASNVWPVYERLSGCPLRCMTMEGQLREALPVPSTAVFSRTDGINDWRGCLQRSTPTSENVEVVSSHHGMAYSPAVLAVIANRLAQPEGAWAPLSCTTTCRFAGL
jgi:pimeloyl-ACP methyl ester carboxylesterase